MKKSFFILHSNFELRNSAGDAAPCLLSAAGTIRASIPPSSFYKIPSVIDYFAARRAQLDEYFQNVAARTGPPKPLAEPLRRAGARGDVLEVLVELRASRGEVVDHGRDLIEGGGRNGRADGSCGGQQAWSGITR